MAILFTVNISQELRKQLETKFPEQTFIFCNRKEDIGKYIDEAEVAVTFGSRINEEMIEKSSKLKWIMLLSAGIDKLPFETIRKKNILVTNARGIHGTQMAEYVISMLLQVYRKEKLLMQAESEHRWARKVQPQEISGRTLLVLGTGAIGQEVARLAKAFHMQTYGVSRTGKSAPYFDKTYTMANLDILLPQADFVVSVLPSTAETRYVLAFNHFQKMRNDAIFVNIGRGDVVKGDVILKAIREQEIAHAVLDVFETEPLPEDHPFWQEENITITPDLSGDTADYLVRALEIFEKNLAAYLAGSGAYMNKIDITRGY